MSWSPASWTASMSQSIQASTPSSLGEPEDAGVQPSPANLSSALDENARQTASWSSARMFTQNAPAERMAGHDVDDLPAQNPTSGGSREIEKKEPTANPPGRPSAPTAV